MGKRITGIVFALGISAIFAFTGFGVWRSASTASAFESSGYILQGEADEVKRLSFNAGEAYASNLSGAVSFTSLEQGKTTVSRDSFVHLDNGTVMALSAGVLLDFNDLSENFINNYYISACLPISGSGGTYTVETNAGAMKFGEHLWKLSDRKYIVEASELSVHFSETDVREVSDYVQVAVTEDGVVHLLTPENLWMTISEEFYIETEGGVKIYPVSQLVDNGTFRLSLAKLSVSPDDAIVLTEDETRRQIVPELNIDTIDGESGEDGEDGQAGQAGVAGESGEAGADGQDGVDGQDGASGEKGVSGSAGADGSKGKNGSSGSDGSNGEGGKRGGIGISGKDAVVESTTNSALPTMTITDWQVSATGLKGTIAVLDESGFLSEISGLPNSDVSCPGRVTITNAATGEVILCYQVPDGYSTDAVTEEDASFSDFYTGSEAVCFSTLHDPLTPDTEYQLSVTAFYKTTDASGMVYSREFIRRTFYTDSTGVALSKEKAAADSVTVKVSISDSYQGSVAKANVYLLTPEQNKSFTAASISDANSYVACAENVEDGKEVTFSGNGVLPNKTYIARTYVETNTGLKTLTQQALEVMTLKRTPVVADGSAPKAAYNRVTGAFEVWRPTVEDQDGGAVSYTYCVYQQNEKGVWEKMEDPRPRTITAAMGEPVEFRLTNGSYRFGVEMEFYDNEKTVLYDLGLSSETVAEGDTMPKLVLTREDTQYNACNGTITIDLNAQSSVASPTAAQPMRLAFYADQIQDNEVSIEAVSTPVTVPGKQGGVGLGTVTLDPIMGNQVKIQLDLENLYKNTNYAITVYGYLNLGDGNGPVYRAIGTVSFRTHDTKKLTAAWNTPGSISTAFARSLTLKVEGNDAYAADELLKGQVTVELYSGTGTGKLRIAQKNFNEREDLEKIYKSEYTITENDFGSPKLDPKGNYTLTVSGVADGSFNMDLGYVNDFPSISNASVVVAAEATPPDLLRDSSKGVTATPIYNNEDGVKYAGSVDENLPEDAIIGYTLAASYDNVQRIGKSITYYAYEYNTFFNALRDNKDPLEYEPLKKMTLNIDSGSDKVPKVAVLFGRAPVGRTDGELRGGHYTYYAGEANAATGALDSGMGRGFRYIFAYTVEYAASGDGSSDATRRYPYDHQLYGDYNRLYGGVEENGTRLGQNVAYILNSGMCEAPSVMPDFHSYVASSNPGAVENSTALIAGGTVELHYTWRDPDQLINKDGTADKNTQIVYTGDNNREFTQNIQKDYVEGSASWCKLTLQYTVQKNAPLILTPAVNISAYKIDYTATLTAFGLEADSAKYPVAQIPVEWFWKSQFEQTGYNEQLVQMEPKLEENYIDFRLVDKGTVTAELTQRAVAMRLEVQVKDKPDTEKTFLLPLTEEFQGVTARLATGLLGAGYMGKEFEVTQAVLLYDTGEQGWDVAEEDGAKGFALQYVNNDDGAFGFSDYLYATDSVSIPGNGALVTQTSSVTMGTLRGTIAAREKDDGKLSFTVLNRVNSRSHTSYLYPSALGVDNSSDKMVEKLSGRYLVPKRIGEFELKFESDNNSGTLDTITPTMTITQFQPSMEGVRFEGLSVAGFDEKGGTIYMAAFESYEQAEELSIGHVVGGKIVEIPINEKGKPTGGDPVINGLDGQKKYYIAFYYKDPDDKNVLLLRGDTSAKAIYEVTTSGEANITVEGMEYRNYSYFEKTLVVNFRISRIFGLTMKYDIYADKAGTQPVLSDKEMRDAGILHAPSPLNGNSNELTIDLTPAPARNKLLPGVTYYLKISAWESSGASAGSVIEEFTIKAIGNYGALIYPVFNGITSKSIAFQVTINDPQYSFMGVDDELCKKSGLYAVRFTDEKGNLLHTSYDDDVYSITELRKEFVLNDETLKNDELGLTENRNIEPDTSYRLNIYAVPDVDHDGSITLKGEEKTWSDFFEKTVNQVKTWGKKFLEVISSFWNPDTTENPAETATRQQLEVASKVQSTTPEGKDWLLNEQNIYAAREGVTTVRIVFEESSGLIDNKGTPVFRQIDWSVEGRGQDGKIVNADGKALYSKGDKLLQEGKDDGGYGFYYFDIPYELGQGRYTVVLQLRETENDPGGMKKITLISGV